MRTRSAGLLVAFALAACFKPTTAELSNQPQRDLIEVSLAVTKERALDAVAAAFVAESLLVESSTAYSLQSAPLKFRSMGIESGQVTYTASLAPSGDSTKVVLRAYHQDVKREGITGEHGTASVRRNPITSHDRAMWIPFWSRLERIGERLRQGGA